MNSLKRIRLQELREKIVNDLDVNDIIHYLISNGAIDEEDKDNITSVNTRKGRTRCLLDVLPTKGLSAYDHFVDSLKEEYGWLYKELSSTTYETDSLEENNFCDALLVGGVPHPPPYNVIRKQKLSEIMEHMKNLRRGHFIVLHGMTGSGKSCLAAAAVSDRHILMTCLKGCVFWVTVGESSDDEILYHMIQLLQHLELYYSVSPHNMFSDNKAIFDIQRAKEKLKHIFLADALREGLLILDDIPSAQFIEAFDVGCKVVVITKDLHCINKVKGRVNIVEINGGFTKKESLSLLAKCINVNPTNLPGHAKRIHDLCQGHPMVLALIAGQLEENKIDVCSSPGRWEYYIDMLQEKDYRQIQINSFSQDNGLFKTISSSIENLPLQLKKYYLDFGLFVEDINIKPEVLQTLWSFKTKYEVEDIMSVFTKKSLAVSKWNEQFHCTVYGVHDLLLHYLKHQLKHHEEGHVNLHKKLLRRYHEVCHGVYANLPNDNYIYSYIGYHLYEAQEWEKFHQIFLDLQFLQSKLRATGPTDVLRDFKKYRQQIVGENMELEAKLNDYAKLLQECGQELHKSYDVDIIQYALQQRKSSHVYKDAYRIAKEHPEKLYLEFLTDKDVVLQPQLYTVPMKEEVFAACFIDDDRILIADNNTIHLWRFTHLQMVKIFHGHKEKVTVLKVDENCENFLSCSDDGSIKVWRVHSPWTPIPKDDGDDCNISSPKNLQRNWTSMFLDDPPMDESTKTLSQHKGPIHDAKFSHTGKLVVSCSEECFIIWNLETNIAETIRKTCTNSKFTACAFSVDDSLLFVGGNDSNLSVYNIATLDFVASFRNCSAVVAVFSPPLRNNQVVVVSQWNFQIWQWEEPNTLPPIDIKTYDPAQCSVQVYAMGRISSSCFGQKENAQYLCATMSRDGVYLATASDNVVSLWNLKETILISECKIYNGFARCLDTYLLDSIQLLMCGSNDKTVKIWHLEQVGTACSVHLTANFHAAWNEGPLPIIAATNSNNTLQVLRGVHLEAEAPLEENKITSCTLASSGSTVFYGCADGHVKCFEIANKTGRIIMKLDSDVVYLQFLQCKEVALLAAGDKNTLKLWKKDNIILPCYGQTSPVVQCFLLPNSTEQLLACNQDAGVKLWDTNSGKLSQVIIGQRWKVKILSVDFARSGELLVLGDVDSTVHAATLTLENGFPFLTVGTLSSYRILPEANAVQCCRIAPSSQVVALGLESGDVWIWDFPTRQILAKLELHRSQVFDLQFSPYINCTHIVSPIILVSIGDKIGWWDISSLSNFKNIANNPLLFNERRESMSHVTSINNWMNKRGHSDRAHLLGCINLAGMHALRIFCSTDFSHFVTIDTSGIVYLMKVVQP